MGLWEDFGSLGITLGHLGSLGIIWSRKQLLPHFLFKNLTSCIQMSILQGFLRVGVTKSRKYQQMGSPTWPHGRGGSTQAFLSTPPEALQLESYLGDKRLTSSKDAEIWEPLSTIKPSAMIGDHYLFVLCYTQGFRYPITHKLAAPCAAQCGTWCRARFPAFSARKSIPCWLSTAWGTAQDT